MGFLLLLVAVGGCGLAFGDLLGNGHRASVSPHDSSLRMGTLLRVEEPFGPVADGRAAPEKTKKKNEEASPEKTKKKGLENKKHEAEPKTPASSSWAVEVTVVVRSKIKNQTLDLAGWPFARMGFEYAVVQAVGSYVTSATPCPASVPDEYAGTTARVMSQVAPFDKVVVVAAAAFVSSASAEAMRACLRSDASRSAPRGQRVRLRVHADIARMQFDLADDLAEAAAARMQVDLVEGVEVSLVVADKVVRPGPPRDSLLPGAVFVVDVNVSASPPVNSTSVDECQRTALKRGVGNALRHYLRPLVDHDSTGQLELIDLRQRHCSVTFFQTDTAELVRGTGVPQSMLLQARAVCRVPDARAAYAACDQMKRPVQVSALTTGIVASARRDTTASCPQGALADVRAASAAPCRVHGVPGALFSPMGGVRVVFDVEGPTWKDRAWENRTRGDIGDLFATVLRAHAGDVGDRILTVRASVVPRGPNGTRLPGIVAVLGVSGRDGPSDLRTVLEPRRGDIGTALSTKLTDSLCQNQSLWRDLVDLAVNGSACPKVRVVLRRIEELSEEVSSEVPQPTRMVQLRLGVKGLDYAAVRRRPLMWQAFGKTVVRHVMANISAPPPQVFAEGGARSADVTVVWGFSGPDAETAAEALKGAVGRSAGSIRVAVRGGLNAFVRQDDDHLRVHVGPGVISVALIGSVEVQHAGLWPLEG